MSDSQVALLSTQGLVVDSGALGAIGYDAIVAGHFHKHQVLSRDPLIAYAGAPYRTDFGEQHQEKGYLIVDLEAGEHAAFDFVPTPARRFVTWDLDLPTGQQPRTEDLEGAVVRLINVDAESDVAELRRLAEVAGAFEVQEIRTRQVEAPDVVGGIDETLSAEAAIAEYFADDPDRDALVELGHDLIGAVS
jgi:exonuclease SbcD